MTTTAVLEAKTAEFDVDDVEYLRHGDKPLLARIYKPRGAGPFPALVECHGGAWCLSDRITEKLRHEAMASHGIVSIALDFRSGNEDPYPASVQDINYAVRWAKAERARAEDPARTHRAVGPVERRASRDARRDAAARSALRGDPAAGRDAARRMRACAASSMSWPVINPLSRYRHAKRAQAPPIRRSGRSASSRARMRIGRAKPTWRRATRCSRSSAARRCSRRRRSGSRAAATSLHDYKDADSSFAGNEPQRFVANYRKAGGEIALEYIEMSARPAIRRTCRRPATCSSGWRPSSAGM